MQRSMPTAPSSALMATRLNPHSAAAASRDRSSPPRSMVVTCRLVAEPPGCASSAFTRLPLACIPVHPPQLPSPTHRTSSGSGGEAYTQRPHEPPRPASHLNPQKRRLSDSPREPIYSACEHVPVRPPWRGRACRWPVIIDGGWTHLQLGLERVCEETVGQLGLSVHMRPASCPARASVGTGKGGGRRVPCTAARPSPTTRGSDVRQCEGGTCW